MQSTAGYHCHQVTARPAASAAAADWAARAVSRHAFGTVGSILPADDFAETLRVLHPFPSTDGSELSWKAVASSVGVAFSPDIDSDSLVEAMRVASPSGAEPASPMTGRISSEIACHILNTVATSSLADRPCFAAIWDGWGELQGETVDAPIVRWPSRSWYLFESSVEDTRNAQELPVPPSLWWPSDRSWFVATEVDHRCSYVSCSKEAATRLIANTSLESFHVDAGSRARG